MCAVQLKVVTCAADRRQTLFCMRKSRGQHGGGRSAWTPDLPKVKMMRYTSPPDPAHPHTHTHTSAHLVHLLLVNQLGGVHKVLAIKQDDSGCNCTCSTPEHHISQGLCPCITWKADSRHLIIIIIIIRNTFRLLLCKPSSF